MRIHNITRKAKMNTIKKWMRLAPALCMAFCSISVSAGTIPWNDGEKGGTLSFGSDASGDNTLQLPQEDYETQVKQLDFYAGLGGTLTVDGGTSGWSFGMPATGGEYSYTTYPFSVNGAATLFSVWLQTVFPTPHPATAAQIEITNAQFRVTREGTKSELHIDGGFWNTWNPYGIASSWVGLMVGGGYGDDQLENRVYVHKGATLNLAGLNWSGAARDYNLFQIDGGKHAVHRNFVFFGDEGHYDGIERAAEMVVTGPDTELNVTDSNGGYFLFRGSANGSGAGMSAPGKHGSDTAILTITNGAKVLAKYITDFGGTKKNVINVSSGGLLSAAGNLTANENGAAAYLQLVGDGGTYLLGLANFGATKGGCCGVALTNGVFSLGSTGSWTCSDGGRYEFVDCAITNGNFVGNWLDLRMRGCTWKLGFSVGFKLGNSSTGDSTAVFDDTVVSHHLSMTFGAAANCCGTCVVTNGSLVTSDSSFTLGAAAGAKGLLTVVDGAVVKQTGNGLRVGSAADAEGVLTVGEGGVFVASAGSDQVGVSGNGTLRIVGGSVTNCSTYSTVYGTTLGVNAGSTGTVELGKDGLLRTAYLTGGSGASRLVADGGTMMPEVKYSASGQPTTEARQERFIYGLTSAEVGAEGLTIISPWATPITVEQAFADLPDVQGRLVLTGSGTKKLTGANTCSLIRIEEGDATVASAVSTVQAVGAGRLLLGDGAATAVTYGGLILGEESTGGILAVDSSDVITTTAAPVFNKAYLVLCDVPANGTYPLVRTSAPVDAAAKAGWAAAYLYAGRQDGKMYAFTVTEAEGVTTFNIVVADARDLDPSLVKKYNGAGGSVTVDDVEVADAVEFNSYSSYSVAGDGLFAFNDTGAGYVNSLLGSHLLGIGLVLPSTTEFHVEEGAELEVSGNIQNGAVRKTGLGMLTLTGENNAFMDESSVEGGIVRFENAGAIGYNEAARANAVAIKRGTLEFESEEAESVTGCGLVIDAGTKTAAIANVKSPLELHGYEWRSGAFLKRGAADLAIDFVGSCVVGKDSGLYTTTTFFETFPANGDSPTSSYGGLTVAEGVLVLRGTPSMTLDSNANIVKIGVNTADGTADPSLVVDGAYLYNPSVYVYFAEGLSKDCFARDFTLKLVNGGKLVTAGLNCGKIEDEDGAGSSALHLLLENGGKCATFNSLEFPASAYCFVDVSATGGSWLNAFGFLFNAPFALKVQESLICKSSGYATGTDATDMKFGFNAVGVADLRNADFRINGLSRAPKTKGKTDFGNGQVTLDFDGTTWWPKASAVNLAIQEAETFTLNVKSGGLVVSNDSGKVFSTAKAFTGAGRIVKAGAGTLAFGRNVTIKGDGATGTETIELERTYTMDAEGGLEIREGTVQLSEGSIRPDVEVEVAEGGVLDLGGNEIKIGGLSGAGTVVNGVLMNSSIGFDAESEEGLAFENCAFAGKMKVVVTGAQPELGKTYRIGTWDGTGTSPDGASWRVLGCGSSVRMKVSVKDGVLYGTFNQVGLTVIVK